MNFDYIVVEPKQVLENYIKGADGLAAIFDEYLAWAESEDRKKQEQREARKLKEEEDRKEETERHRVRMEKYLEERAVFDTWAMLPWLIRLFVKEPKCPGEPMFGLCSLGMAGFGWTWYPTANMAERARDLKREAEQMIASTKAEPKEFHFTEAQFRRMEAWASGQVVLEVLDLMGKNPESVELARGK